MEPRLSKPTQELQAALSNCAALNEDGTIPALISEIFLTNLRDVQLLKTCRLVCKHWNIAASESLRACSRMCLRELWHFKLNNFRNLLLKRSFGPLQHLPSPFQNFHAYGIAFTDPTFIDLALLPNVVITSLIIVLDDEEEPVDQSHLCLVLAANKASITDLRIVGSENFELNEELWRNDEIKLERLNSLTLKGTFDESTQTALVKNFLNGCQLERLDLLAKGELIMRFLPKEIAKHLKHLKIEILESFSLEALEHLGKLRFSNLKTLAFRAHDPYNNAHPIQKLIVFFQHVSPFLEVLETNVPISSASELRFPKLKVIQAQSKNFWSAFTPDRFPVLSKVFLEVRNPMLEILENYSNPHFGVESIVINLITIHSANESFDQDFLIFLTYMSRQFPNVSSFEVVAWKFCEITITDICDTFPKLTSLRLDGTCNFFSFSGMRDSVVAKYLELNWPIEKIPRRKSIMDLIELESLSFGRRFFLHPNMITHCLPRLPKLRQIRFHWNESLSAPLLRDSLGHLEKISISNSSASAFQDTMAQVSQMVPNAHLE